MVRKVVDTLSITIVVITIILNAYIYNYMLLSQESCSWKSNDRDGIRILAFGDPQIRGSNKNTPLRTRLDIFGNDHYLGHIFNVLSKRLAPTHVAVMGDLLSSQWINNVEFYRRTERYKNRIFKDWQNEHPEFVNVSGNHDIGYGGEMTAERVIRFEDIFGKVNYYKIYNEGQSNSWRLVVLNSLALDGPFIVQDYHDDTIKFLKQMEEMEFKGSTVLLTHVPLYKVPGLCRDGTYFSYYDSGHIRAQNHLSPESSTLVLNSLFTGGNIKGGVIMTGHDHEGCQSAYELKDSQWIPKPWTRHVFENSTGVAEITVRSMMGEYGGNAGLLTGNFDRHQGIWEFEFNLCPFAVQHVWWTTKVFSIITIAVLLLQGALLYTNNKTQDQKKEKKTN